jgi:glycosyltransferase involved in cell wall biosynthesis
MRQYKILFIVNSAKFFITHRLHLALAAKKEGFDVHIAAPIDKKSKKYLLDFGFRLHEIYLEQYSLNIVKEIKCICSINILIANIKPELLHLITIKPIFYGSIFSSLLKVPCVIISFTGLGHLHIALDFKTRMIRKIIYFFFKFIFNRSKLCVIFQNSDDQFFFVKNKIIKKDQSCLIKGSGVDLKKFRFNQKEPQGIITVMMASRMLWMKGLSDFIEAAKKLKARDLNVRFVLVGKPELNVLYGANLKTLIKLNKSGIVEWWGFKENMDKIIQQSHIFCLPTKYGEGVPKVLIEAAACGKPLVGSNTSGCREIIFDGLNGFLSEPGNIDSLSSSLERLILSRKLRLNMGLKSRIIAESEFSISEVTNKTITQYKKLLKLLP